jgi:pimeloyl-ACP methyl ester carboxylesterase
MALLMRVGTGDQQWEALVAPHRREVQMGGYRLHLVDIGRGEPVVLVHGYADSSYSWHANVEALVDTGLRVLLVDLPGLGRSGKPPGHRFSMERQAAEVLDLTRRLGIERFHLVGHSMGGGIVLHLCQSHPERVRRAVVVAPVSKRPRRPMFLARPGAGLLAELVAGRLVFWHSLRQVFHDGSKVRRALVEEYARPSTRRGFWLDLARLSREYFSEEFDRMVSSLDEITVPLLIIWGAEDRWLSPWRGPVLARQIPGSRLELVQGAGHNAQQERPEAINPLLVDHLAPTG